MEKFPSRDNIQVVVYHSPCIDGAAAALCARVFSPNISLVPFDYTPKTVDALFKFTDKQILFVDCAPSREVYNRLVGDGNTVSILDHHAGNALEYFSTPRCVFDPDLSGCQLAWSYFMFGLQEPKLLTMIGERDRGAFSDENRCLGYALMDLPNGGATVENLEPLLARGEPALQELIQAGQAIQKTIDATIKKHKVFLVSHEHEINGLLYELVFIEVQSHKFLQEMVEEVIPPDSEAVVVFHQRLPDGTYKLYLRTRGTADLSALAKTIGGGGHPKAAGAVVKELPWLSE